MMSVLALVAAALLAFVALLPSSDARHGFALSSGELHVSGATNRRLRAFAVTQIAAPFVPRAGAGMPVRTLLVLQAARLGLEDDHMFAVNAARVDRVAFFGSNVPWRDSGNLGDGFKFSVEGRLSENAQDDPRAPPLGFAWLLQRASRFRIPCRSVKSTLRTPRTRSQEEYVCSGSWCRCVRSALRPRHYAETRARGRSSALPRLIGAAIPGALLTAARAARAGVVGALRAE